MNEIDITPWFDDDASWWRTASIVVLLLLGQAIRWIEQYTPSWINVEQVLLWMFPWLHFLN